MQTLQTTNLLAHERRVCRVLESRGQGGLGEALARLDGTMLGKRHRIDSLYAVGGEGVVYLASDLDDPSVRLVAKLPLVPFHRPLELSSNFLRRRREQLREESRNLESSESRFLPRSHGIFEIDNALLDRVRGGEFAQPEPVIVMEWMPGFDLDLWLARVHRSDVPVTLLRRNLDRVAVVLLQALVDLEEHGFFYADLRPGNLRMMGRPERRIRLLDAGSLVERGDESGRFPHVPSYLPPELFRRKHQTGETILPTCASQAIMAGRTLYEVATGRIPFPGQEIDRDALRDSHVSAPVADVIDGLATGSFGDVRPALRYLERRAVKRVPIPMSTHAPALPAIQVRPTAAQRASAAQSASPAQLASPAQGARPAAYPATYPAAYASAYATAAAATRPAGFAPPAPSPVQQEIAAALDAATRTTQEIVLPATPPRPWWKRLLGVN